MAAPNPPRLPPTATTITTTTTTTATATPAPKAIQATPPLTIDASAIVADKATLMGAHRITIGPKATIHPFARLDSSAGELDIGEACSIWEKAIVGGSAVLEGSEGTGAPVGDAVETPSSTRPLRTRKTTLGPYSTVSAHASVGAFAAIGAHSIVEVGATVGTNCSIGSYCRLASMTCVDAGATLDDYTVVYFLDGEQKRRVNVSLRDFERAKELEARAREKERELVGRIVKGSAATGKWR